MALFKLENKKPKFYASILFIALEIACYVVILSTNGLTYSISAFSSIMLAFILPLIFLKSTPSHILTVCALFFTMIADFLLCGFINLTPTIQTFSMISFLLVQTCYFVRIFIEQKTKTLKLVHALLRILVTLLAIITTFFVLKETANFLAVISVVYYANLLLNAVFSGINIKTSPYLFIGLILFACCDLFVGAQFIGDFISLPENSIFSILLSIDFNMAWLFYLPSQVIISLSIANEKRT